MDIAFLTYPGRDAGTRDWVWHKKLEVPKLFDTEGYTGTLPWAGPPFICAHICIHLLIKINCCDLHICLYSHISWEMNRNCLLFELNNHVSLQVFRCVIPTLCFQGECSSGSCPRTPGASIGLSAVPCVPLLKALTIPDCFTASVSHIQFTKTEWVSYNPDSTCTQPFPFCGLKPDYRFSSPAAILQWGRSITFGSIH